MRRQPKARARGHRRRDLAARKPREALEPLFAVGGGVLGDDGDEVDAVEAKAGDIEGTVAGCGNLERDAQAPNPSSDAPLAPRGAKIGPRMSFRGRGVTAMLAAIVLGAAAVRFWGIGFGLPHTQARPDETVAIGVALAFLRGDFSPRFFDYPWLYMWAISALYVAYYAWGAATGAFGSLADVVASWPVHWEPFFLINRTLSATLGTATVVVVFGIARRLWDEATGLVAALFLALAFLHVRESHFGTTDVTMTFFVVLSVGLLLRAHDTRRPALFAAAGLVGGLAAATKYNGVLLFVPLAASAIVHAAESGTQRWAALFDRRLWLFAGGFLATFLIGVPFIVLDNTAFNAAMAELWHSMLNATPQLALTSGWRHHLEISLRYGLGLPLLATGLAGTVLVLARETRTGVLLLSFPLAYFAVAGSLEYLFPRYTMPVVPFLAIVAARAVTWAVDQTPARALASSVRRAHRRRGRCDRVALRREHVAVRPDHQPARQPSGPRGLVQGERPPGKLRAPERFTVRLRAVRSGTGLHAVALGSRASRVSGQRPPSHADDAARLDRRPGVAAAQARRSPSSTSFSARGTPLRGD